MRKSVIYFLFSHKNMVQRYTLFFKSKPKINKFSNISKPNPQDFRYISKPKLQYFRSFPIKK